MMYEATERALERQTQVAEHTNSIGAWLESLNGTIERLENRLVYVLRLESNAKQVASEPEQGLVPHADLLREYARILSQFDARLIDIIDRLEI